MAVVVSNECHLFFFPLTHKNTVRLCRLADKKNGSKEKIPGGEVGVQLCIQVFL